MFVLKSKHECMMREAEAAIAAQRGKLKMQYISLANFDRRVAALEAEIRDRIVSETDAREQLRAINARQHRDRGAGGRFVKAA